MVPAGLCAYRDLRRKRARKWGDTVTQPDDPRRVGVIVELIDHTIAIAKLNERGDLVQRLTRARQRITDPQVRVVIAGLLKQGKSQLLNSLLNLPAARVGDDEATVVITVVSYSAQPSARLVLAAGPDGTTAAVDIPVDDISTDVRRAPHAGGREVLRVEVGAPSPLLRGGLAFIDTPGVGGLGQPHLSATLGLLPEADAVLVVSDTSQEFTEPEMWFVRQAHQICPVGAVVATKTDLYPRWREIVNANAAHLQRARVPMPIIAVSSLLRSHAVTLNDKELNEESNFPAIVKFLSEQVLSRATERVRAGVLGEIRSATEQLAVSLGSELSVVNDPNLRDRLASDLERRKREAQQAVQQTALWQQVLGDGFNDLTADVDHDLRTRFRTVTEDAERQIDSCDPTAHWAEIGNDVENAIATAVGDNFVWAYQRSEALADDVARSFADAGLDSVLSAELSPHVMGTDFGRLKALGRMESKPLRRGHKMIIGMRGSYGGVVMIGMLSSVVGLGLFNPLSVGAGLILGRMAYKEDKQNRLLRVRSEAKANVRRFVDDISFVVSKQSRDRLKMIQRLLRDHYREIAEEITRSLTESLQATIAAAQVAETDAFAGNDIERRRNRVAAPHHRRVGHQCRRSAGPGSREFSRGPARRAGRSATLASPCGASTQRSVHYQGLSRGGAQRRGDGGGVLCSPLTRQALGCHSGGRDWWRQRNGDQPPGGTCFRAQGAATAARGTRVIRACAQNVSTFSMLTNMPWPVRLFVKRVPSVVASMVQPCAS